jgi:hypothetical protein
LAVNCPERLADKPKPPPLTWRGLENHKRKVFEPLYFIKGDKQKSPPSIGGDLKIIREKFLSLYIL